MSDPIRASIVRIATNGGTGTGFFIAENLIVTCFHVIRDSLNAIDLDESSGNISFIVRHPQKSKPITKIATLIPNSDSESQDIAFLRVAETDVTELTNLGIRPLKLTSSTAAGNLSFTTFGYGGSLERQNSGGHDTGNILTTEEYFYREDNLKIRVLHLKSADISRGYSGAPVFAMPDGDTSYDFVVGMIVRSEYVPFQIPDIRNSAGEYILKSSSAYAIPSETIQSVLPHDVDIKLRALPPQTEGFYKTISDIADLGSFITVLLLIVNWMTGTLLNWSFSDLPDIVQAFLIIPVVLALNLLIWRYIPIFAQHLLELPFWKSRFPGTPSKKISQRAYLGMAVALTIGMVGLHVYNNLYVFNVRDVHIDNASTKLPCQEAGARIRIALTFEEGVNLPYLTDGLPPTEETKWERVDWPEICEREFKEDMSSFMVNNGLFHVVGYYDISDSDTCFSNGINIDAVTIVPSFVRVTDQHDRQIIREDLPHEIICKK